MQRFRDTFRIPTRAELRQMRRTGRRLDRAELFSGARAPSAGGSPADSDPHPPVPPAEPIPFPSFPASSSGPSLMRDGRYYLRIFRYDGEPPLAVGVFRLKRDLGSPYASGDLYVNRHLHSGADLLRRRSLVYPRSDYLAWLRVIKFEDTLGTDGQVVVTMDVCWMDDDGELIPDEETGPVTAVLKQRRSPTGYPYTAEYYSGELSTEEGVTVGRMSIGRVGSRVRTAVLEIDTVGDAVRPDPGAAPDWGTIMATAGWDLTVRPAEAALADPLDGEGYELAELHEFMTTVARDPAVSLDWTWYYHLLVVPRIDSKWRGYMYDFAEWDLNAVPREGAAIASEDVYVDGWNGPERLDWLRWGDAKNQEYGAVGPAHYRVALHELGHAFGLDHNATGTAYLMNVTPHVAVIEGEHWPDKIDFEWEHEDLLRLAHWPDPWVRPGATPWSSYSSPGDSYEPEGVKLAIDPVAPAFPWGAPVRLDIALENRSADAVEMPTRIGVSSGALRAQVTSPMGEAREVRFANRARHVGAAPVAAGGVVTGGLTLLSDPSGPLFPIPGRYELELRVEWPDRNDSVRAVVVNRVAITIVAAADPQTELLASRALGEAQLHAQLVLGGDAFQQARRLIDELIANPQLGPHYRFLEGRRLATRFLDRPADLDAAQEVVEGAVLNRSEQETVEAWGKKQGGEDEARSEEDRG